MSLVGNLQDLALADIFQIVGLSGKSGVLRLETDETQRARIVFLKGKIVSAWGPGALKILKELLDTEGVVIPNALSRLQRERIDQLSEISSMFSSASLDGKRKRAFLEKLTREILVDLLGWADGAFHFELRDHEQGHPAIPPEWLLVPEGIAPGQAGLEGAKAQDEAAAYRTPPPVPPPTNAPAVAPMKLAADEPLIDLAEELRDQFEGSRNYVPTSLSPGLGLLKSMLLELHMPNIHTYITLLLLRYASALMNRAVLFEAQDDQFVAIGEFGIAKTKEVSARMVRDIRVPRSKPGVFETVTETLSSTKTKLNLASPWDKHLMEKLGGQMPAEVFIGPLVCDRRLVAVLYGDNVPEQDPIGDTQSLEIFLSQAGVAMERRLATRQPA